MPVSRVELLSGNDMLFTHLSQQADIHFFSVCKQRETVFARLAGISHYIPACIEYVISKRPVSQ